MDSLVVNLEGLCTRRCNCRVCSRCGKAKCRDFFGNSKHRGAWVDKKRKWFVHEVCKGLGVSCACEGVA